ncbi:GAF and ANTAR domain-containing protein [Blastococcus sp. SYSU DS0539]
MTPPDDDALVVQPAFDELARLSFAEHSLESVLRTVTELATRILPGQPVASVTIVADGRPSTVAASGDLAVRLDEVQYRLGTGPCLDAATTGRTSTIADTRAAERWAPFAVEAAAQGCESVLSHPFPAQERVQGALNVYARDFSIAGDRTRGLVSRLAAYAVGPVSNMYLYETAVERAQHLQAALEYRAVIDQAKGILMERHKLTADQAFRLLAKVSMETNTKLRDVAAQFVLTGDLRPA